MALIHPRQTANIFVLTLKDALIILTVTYSVVKVSLKLFYRVSVVFLAVTWHDWSIVAKLSSVIVTHALEM